MSYTYSCVNHYLAPLKGFLSPRALAPSGATLASTWMSLHVHEAVSLPSLEFPGYCYTRHLIVAGLYFVRPK